MKEKKERAFASARRWERGFASEEGAIGGLTFDQVRDSFALPLIATLDSTTTIYAHVDWMLAKKRIEWVRSNWNSHCNSYFADVHRVCLVNSACHRHMPRLPRQIVPEHREH
jgi:hypothetical protein